MPQRVQRNKIVITFADGILKKTTTKMEKVKTFDLVKSVLESDPNTRDDDFELICECSKRFGLDGCTFAEALTLWRYHKFPTFEGITRARRKVQEMYPSLCSEERIAEMRRKQEREYHDFYLANK